MERIWETILFQSPHFTNEQNEARGKEGKERELSKQPADGIVCVTGSIAYSTLWNASIYLSTCCHLTVPLALSYFLMKAVPIEFASPAKSAKVLCQKALSKSS